MANPATDTPSRRHAAQQPPQDIRSIAVARGYRWDAMRGQWYHESAERRHTYRGLRRKHRLLAGIEGY